MQLNKVTSQIAALEESNKTLVIARNEARVLLKRIEERDQEITDQIVEIQKRIEKLQEQKRRLEEDEARKKRQRERKPQDCVGHIHL